MIDNEIRRLFAQMAGLGLLVLFLVIGAISFLFLAKYNPDIFFKKLSVAEQIENKPVNQSPTFGEDISQTDLVEGTGRQVVYENCGGCHSLKLVTQNRFTKEGWLQVIRWMQETQGLWDLGANEDLILEYLSTYLAPEAKGRRKPLEVEWYTLE